MDPKSYLGDATLEKMRKTKWYVLARFIDQLLYDGRVELRDPLNKYSQCYRTSEKAYVGEKVPAGVSILGHEGSYIETEKGLRELMLECERMAIKEVT